ncbi:MAG: LD-carboxypeptidase [Schleiferiaceae bacterium]|nr:LD-carboxypeptidase [Schleiferiaceae bacterium]
MIQSVSPPFLKPGDAVAIVSVSRFAEDGVIELAETWIREQGWRPLCAPHLGAKQEQFGGSDEQRAGDVNWAIAQDEVKAIWSIRGGYGAVRMVDGVNWDGLKAQPKWLIGFSDFTMILGEAFQHQLCAIHSWMPIQRPLVTEVSSVHLAKLLGGQPQALHSKNHPLNRHGRIQGQLIGGNLSVLYSMLGSSSFPNLEGCILALEDLDEYRYHLDRMMWGLRRAGVLHGVLGLAIGAFSDMKDNAIPFGREPIEIIRDAFPEGLPMAFGLPFGHLEDNEPFITGYAYQLEVDLSGGHLSPL